MFNKVNNTSKTSINPFQDVQLRKKLTDTEKLIKAQFKTLSQYKEISLKSKIHKVQEKLYSGVDSLKSSISKIYMK